MSKSRDGLVIRPSEEAVEERQVEQTHRVDEVIEGISEVLVDIVVAIVRGPPSEVEIARQNPVAWNVACDLCQILQEHERVTVVSRCIYVSKGKREIGRSRDEESSEGALPVDEGRHGKRSSVPRSQEPTPGVIGINTGEI